MPLDIAASRMDMIADFILLPSSWAGLLTDYRMVLLLVVTGLVLLTIAMNYRNNPKSLTYKKSVLVGVVMSLILGAHVALQYSLGDWSGVMIILMAAIVFALLFRPVMYTNMAFGISAMILLAVYMSIALLVPDLYALMTVDGLLLLSVLVAVLAYNLLHFAESGMEMAARVLNAWPILVVMALVCFAEAVAIAVGFPLISA